MTASERQEGGDHYTKLAIQPLTYCMANGLDAMQSNVVKYTTRFRDKGGVDDLRKAIHVLELLIEWESRAPADEPQLPLEDDGWIEWGGGECPVPADSHVQVRFRDQSESMNAAPAGAWYWKPNGDQSDIVAYRVTG